MPYETFQREIDEELTAEERKEVELEEANRQLRRSDPAAYTAKLAAEQAAYIRNQIMPNGSGVAGMLLNSRTIINQQASPYIAGLEGRLPREVVGNGVSDSHTHLAVSQSTHPPPRVFGQSSGDQPELRPEHVSGATKQDDITVIPEHHQASETTIHRAGGEATPKSPTQKPSEDANSGSPPPPREFLPKYPGLQDLLERERKRPRLH